MTGEQLHITADKMEIKEFPKLPSATSFIRETLYESLHHINKQSHKSSATGFIGGMDNGRNRDS